MEERKAQCGDRESSQRGGRSGRGRAAGRAEAAAAAPAQADAVSVLASFGGGAGAALTPWPAFAAMWGGVFMLR
jgi:hypothetical protein